MCSGHNQSQQGSITGPRQSLIGSSPIHTQDYACSELEEIRGRNFGSLLRKERTNQQITAEKLPFLDLEEKKT